MSTSGDVYEASASCAERPHPSGRRGVIRYLAPSFSDMGRWWTLAAPLALLSLLALATAAGLSPVLRDAVLARTPENAGRMQALLWVVALATPLTAGAKAAVLGGVAWAVLVLLGAAPRLRATVSAILYGEVILALQGIWMVATLLVIGGVGLHPVDLTGVSAGLDSVIPDRFVVLDAIGKGVTPFHVAWAFFLVVALSALARTSRLRAGVTVAVLWGGVVGVGVLRALWS